jgi:hypothetical protein
MSDHDTEVSRRELLRTIGASLALGSGGAGLLSAQDAAHVHRIISDENSKGDYKPKSLNAHEYATVRRLADLIIPRDEHSKGALDAGAPEFIDILASINAQLAAIYTGGIGWLDHQMNHRYEATFIDAKPAEQTAMLDLIAYRRNEAENPELGPGIRFFAWARTMVADAFYTSKAGRDDLGFEGNGAMASFSVPEEVLQYALKRSPV